jgi:hypothetical protein
VPAAVAFSLGGETGTLRLFICTMIPDLRGHQVSVANQKLSLSLRSCHRETSNPSIQTETASQIFS